MAPIRKSLSVAESQAKLSGALAAWYAAREGTFEDFHVRDNDPAGEMTEAEPVTKPKKLKINGPRRPKFTIKIKRTGSSASEQSVGAAAAAISDTSTASNDPSAESIEGSKADEVAVSSPVAAETAPMARRLAKSKANVVDSTSAVNVSVLSNASPVAALFSAIDVDSAPATRKKTAKTASSTRKTASGKKPVKESSAILKPAFPSKVRKASAKKSSAVQAASSSVPTIGSLQSAASTKWQCSNLGCNTDQTSKEVEHYGRKAISHFFGRNKKETKTIPAGVWTHYCRKCYQRGKYAADKVGCARAAHWVLDNLETQLVRIELWRPEATFSVQLDSRAKERVKRWEDLKRHYNGDADRATNEIENVQSTSDKKPDAHDLFKIKHGQKIESDFKPEAKTATFRDANAIVAWMRNAVNTGDMTVLPPIELLIQPAKPNDTINDPATNFSRWLATVNPAAPAQAAVQVKQEASAPSSADITRGINSLPPTSPPQRASSLESHREVTLQGDYSTFRLYRSPPAKKRKARDDDDDAAAGGELKRTKLTVDTSLANDVDIESPSVRAATV